MEMIDKKFVLLKIKAPLLFIALNASSMLQFIELAFVLMHNIARAHCYKLGLGGCKTVKTKHARTNDAPYAPCNSRGSMGSFKSWSSRSARKELSGKDEACQAFIGT
jgi:hypothetical protein